MIHHKVDAHRSTVVVHKSSPAAVIAGDIAKDCVDHPLHRSAQRIGVNPQAPEGTARSAVTDGDCRAQRPVGQHLFGAAALKTRRLISPVSRHARRGRRQHGRGRRSSQHDVRGP